MHQYHTHCVGTGAGRHVNTRGITFCLRGRLLLSAAQELQRCQQQHQMPETQAAQQHAQKTAPKAAGCYMTNNPVAVAVLLLL